MKQRRAKHVLIILGAMLAMAAIIVGSVFGARAYQENKREETRIAAERKAEAEAEAAEAERVTAIEECQDRLGDYMDALAEIDARLDVGLNQSSLSELAGTASVEESRIDEHELSDTCQQAKDEADDALDAYASTASEWDDCIWEDWCDPDYDIDLQGPWAEASVAREKAEALMNGKAGEGA